MLGKALSWLLTLLSIGVLAALFAQGFKAQQVRPGLPARPLPAARPVTPKPLLAQELPVSKSKQAQDLEQAHQNIAAAIQAVRTNQTDQAVALLTEANERVVEVQRNLPSLAGHADFDPAPPAGTPGGKGHNAEASAAE